MERKPHANMGTGVVTLLSPVHVRMEKSVEWITTPIERSVPDDLYPISDNQGGG